jgi:diguanylate cyclase (GGDEF)-like protein
MRSPRSASRRFVRLVVLVGASSAVFCAWLALNLGGAQLTTAVDDLGQTIAALMAAGAGLIAVRRERGRIRRGWRLLALSELSFAVGQATYSWYEVILGRRPSSPSLADPGFLLAMVLSLSAMVVFFSPRVGLTSRLRAVVDALIVGSALLLAAWLTVLGHAFGERGGSILSQAMGLAYLVGTVVVLTTVVIVAQGSRSTDRLALSWVVIGMAAIAGSNAAFLYLIEKGAYSTSRLVDSGWFVGFLILALAAIRRPSSRPRRVRKHDSVWLPYIPVAGGTALVASRVADGHRLDAFGTWCLLAVLLFVLVRQLLALRENRALTEDLEGQVDARTLQLAHEALHDPLTGLANRSLFTNRVRHELVRTRRSGTQVAILFIDLDEFKSVNDTLGHAAGDELLRDVASRLSASARAGDTISRLGGDEFGLLLEDCNEHAATYAAERVKQAFAAPVLLVDDNEIALSASIGIAIGGPSTESVSELLRNADIAMYSAKAHGKGCHDVFRTEMRDAVVDRVNLLSDLRRALERDEFELHYQPLIDLSTNQIAGFEALLRWHHPTRGEVSPLKFIPIAEDTGLIIPIGRWVLAQAVAQLCRWDALGANELTMSVNVSGRQLMSESFRTTAQAILDQYGLTPTRLTLELTESILLGGDTITRLRELKQLGVKLAIDDFGTGFSSLSYLQRLPVDAIKIDKSFVDHIDVTGQAGDLARSVIALGDALHLDVVAEGIEHGFQADRLREIGCRLGQGYLFARPLPHAEIEQLLRSRSQGAVTMAPAGGALLTAAPPH